MAQYRFERRTTMVKDTELFENANIGFRNFSGKEQEFNQAGKRNFCLFIEKERADKMFEEGWNVRCKPAKDDQEDPRCILQVAVSYDNIPPHIVMVSSSGKTVLDNDTIHLLDEVEIAKVDLIIRPYNWVMREGKPSEERGVKAYAKSMYVIIVEDELALKYSDGPGESDGD